MNFIVKFKVLVSFSKPRHIPLKDFNDGENKLSSQIVIVLSAGLWNAYYRQAWRSAAAQLRGRGVDLYVAGILPQGAMSFFRDLPWTSSKVFEASAGLEMNSFMPEMMRQIVFGGWWMRNCQQRSLRNRVYLL